MDRGGCSQRGFPSILQRLTHVSCRGYACTRKEHVIVKQGGTAEAFVLGNFFAEDFFMKKHLDVRWRRFDC